MTKQKQYNYRANKLTKLSKKKYILLALALLVAAAAVLIVLERKGVTNLYTKNAKSTDTSDGDSSHINYGPPTEEERESGDKKKAEISKEKDPPTTVPSTAQVTIGDAAQYDDVVEVTSSVTNVYEDGTCTFKFEKGTSTFTKETTAYRDVSTTICTNPLVPRSEFSAAGDWKVTVNYKSASGIAGSATRTVTVK